MLSANLSAIFYLISGILFILALRGLSSPETSRQGNFFGILYAIKAPINPPIKRNIKTITNPVEKLPIDKKVTVIAIIIPKIPNKFPCLDVSGEDSPLKAKMNNTPEIK